MRGLFFGVGAGQPVESRDGGLQVGVERRPPRGDSAISSGQSSCRRSSRAQPGRSVASAGSCVGLGWTRCRLVDRPSSQAGQQQEGHRPCRQDFVRVLFGAS